MEEDEEKDKKSNRKGKQWRNTKRERIESKKYNIVLEQVNVVLKISN